MYCYTQPHRSPLSAARPHTTPTQSLPCCSTHRESGAGGAGAGSACKLQVDWRADKLWCCVEANNVVNPGTAAEWMLWMMACGRKGSRCWLGPEELPSSHVKLDAMVPDLQFGCSGPAIYPNVFVLLSCPGTTSTHCWRCTTCTATWERTSMPRYTRSTIHDHPIPPGRPTACLNSSPSRPQPINSHLACMLTMFASFSIHYVCSKDAVIGQRPAALLLHQRPPPCMLFTIGSIHPSDYHGSCVSHNPFFRAYSS